MIRIFSISFFILLITTALGMSQQINHSTDEEDAQNQQINKDEGYGPNDAEYYNAEGINSEDSKVEEQRHSEHN